MNKLLILILLIIGTIHAQWQENGVVVCDTNANSGFYMLAQVAADGDGGAFVCWKDARSGLDYDIYYQHILSDGSMQFEHNGIPLCDTTGTQQFSRIISDGKGGAYAVWEDGRDGINLYTYAQRISNTGEKLWASQGIKVAEKSGLMISIAKNVKGNLLAGWIYKGVEDVVIQQLDSLGNRIWPDSGVQVANRLGHVYSNDIAIAEDGCGGAYVVWAEGNYPNYQIFVQRIDSSGNKLLQQDGIPLTDSTMQDINVGCSRTLDEGALVSWASLPIDVTSQDTAYEYVQKVSPNGDLMWGQEGIRVGGVLGGGARRHTDDLQGGAFIGHGRWIQHVTKEGNLLWPGEGVPFTMVPTHFVNSSQTLNNITGGIWNFWGQQLEQQTKHIYGQYIDSNGNRLWESNGKPICTATNFQDWPKSIMSGNGSAILVWDDFRNGHSNIFAAKVDTFGVITHVADKGEVIPTFPYLEQNYPNPFNPETTINYSLPNTTKVKLTVFDLLGREIVGLVNKEQLKGNYFEKFSSKNLASGIYFYQLTTDQLTITKKMVIIH